MHCNYLASVGGVRNTVQSTDMPITMPITMLSTNM